MKQLWDLLFGPDADSHTITALQMTTRAILIFFAVLALLRLSGARTFGANTAFDMVVKIMLGAVMSRAVVAASPFWGTLLAGLVLVGLHRVLAWAAFRSHFVGKLVKGEGLMLAENGRLNEPNLRRNHLTHDDLLEGLRESGNIGTVEDAEAVRLERDGSISVVKKQE
ncbi:DUF421 domain-containing protein [Hymenobacter negativus]|uniref:DUF421 domain-containing protein n=1 Tax=Hymenobacter negativus TaxID=2795026 RepID=A0ABS3QMU4_9BACT|nr:YetF domain-containing protein [Hymenobacter negativus]MBO2012333.1 DUF421 domain-containing protein [Hymenobacter negativus]